MGAGFRADKLVVLGAVFAVVGVNCDTSPKESRPAAATSEAGASPSAVTSATSAATTNVQAVAPVPRLPDGGPAMALELSSAANLMCVSGLESDATKCWGANLLKLFGDKVLYRAIATDVPSLRGAKAIGGSDPLCASFSGKVRCWRDSRFQEVAGIDHAVDLSSNDGTACVVTERGEALCWGKNGDGMLGDGTSTSRDTPAPVKGVTGAAEIRVGAGTVFVRKKDGGVMWWGRVSSPPVPALRDRVTSVPLPFAALGGVASLRGISSAGRMQCVIQQGGKVACWDQEHPPAPVANVEGALDLAAAEHESCAVLPGGQVRCWTHDFRAGRLKGVSGATRIVAVRSGGFCSLDTSLRVTCWGTSPQTRGDGKRPELPSGGPPREPNQVLSIMTPAAACQPDCADHTCGDDGCGNVACGACKPGELCVNGRCGTERPAR
jgi:hypothetical protein